jgi:hypothetical protein
MNYLVRTKRMRGHHNVFRDEGKPVLAATLHQGSRRRVPDRDLEIPRREQLQPGNALLRSLAGAGRRAFGIMPILRYFVFVGGALLALLLVANWCLPSLNVEAALVGADHSTIRIHSQQKWPVAVVIDTTQPTLVPTPAPVVDETPAAKPAREAFAMATEIAAAKPAEAVKPVKHHTRRSKVARAPVGGPSHDPFGFRPMWAAGW